MTDAQDNTTLETERQQPKGGAGKLIAVVIVLTLLAILLVPGHKESKKTGETEATSGERPSLLAGDDERAGSADTRNETASAHLPSQGEAADRGPGSAARALIRELRTQTPPDLERAYQAAQKYQQQGQLDDAYLLYFYAAREGYGPAALQLAREADPSSFKQGGLLDAPDELQANKWYSLAQQAGVAEASAALSKLRSAVEQRAEAGDNQARRIMLQWK